MLRLIERDGYLSPYTVEIEGRYNHYLHKEARQADTLRLCIRVPLLRTTRDQEWLVLQRMGTQCHKNIPHRRLFRLERIATV